MIFNYKTAEKNETKIEKKTTTNYECDLEMPQSLTAEELITVKNKKNANKNTLFPFPHSPLKHNKKQLQKQQQKYQKDKHTV